MRVKPLHLVVALLIIVGAFALMESRQGTKLESFSEGLDRQQTKIIVDGCARGNLRSAYELANESDGAERAKLVRETLPLVNCKKSSRVGGYFTVPRRVQERYVAIVVEDHRWPTLSASNKIVGSEPLPGNLQKP